MSDTPTPAPPQYDQVRAGTRVNRVAARVARTPAAGVALRWGVRGTLTTAAWLLADLAVRRGPAAVLTLPPSRYLVLVALAWGVAAAGGAVLLRALRRRGLHF